MGKYLLDRNKIFMYLKVVSFFLIGFFLFFITFFSIKEAPIFKGTYIIIAKFNFAEGLRPSSPVRFCGVDVGDVQKVVIEEEKSVPLVYVYAKIHKGIHIPRGSYFFINSLSLFGEKYLEITPPVIVGEHITEWEMIEGISPIPLFNVFATFTKTMEEISEFVKEGTIKTSIENTLLNLEDITLEFKGLMLDMKNKEGTIGRLLYDDSLYNVTEEFVGDLKEHPWKLLYKPKESKRKRK